MADFTALQVCGRWRRRRLCGRGSRAVAAAAPSLQCDTHTSTAVADKNKTRPSGVVTRATGANNGHGDFSGQCPFTRAAPPCPPHSCTVVGRIAQAKDTLSLPFPLPLSREPGSRQTLPLRPLAFPPHKCQTGGATISAACSDAAAAPDWAWSAPTNPTPPLRHPHRRADRAVGGGRVRNGGSPSHLHPIRPRAFQGADHRVGGGEAGRRG